MFAAFGVQIDTPGAAFQLIVPVMFVFMAVRYFGLGIQTFASIWRGEEPSHEGEAPARSHD